MKLGNLSISALGLIFLAGCSHPGAAVKNTGAEAAVVQRPLLETEAQQRFDQVSRPTYTLWFGLGDTSEDYDGRTVIQFDLKENALKAGKDLFIDFHKGQIRSITLNQAAYPSNKYHYDGNRIYIPVVDLQPGGNRIEISFTRAYSQNGAGLHRFKDPVDGKVYVYSNFEPYDARQMFPCFDQPDLKASFELTVETPESWTVIANTTEHEEASVDGRKSWAFPPSPLISTYLFALHAGPYAVWKSSADGVPLRLFARQSVAKYVDHDEWLDITRRGLKWYNQTFDYAYPFAKYDQIIVPDFNAGAMENVAAVTFSERMIYRSKATQDQHQRRANTILHEMAHMWFGDLVTMKWWNGLWLNESFATFVAAWAVDRATQYKTSWQLFSSESKDWAYWEDQLVTTHPIEGKIADTDQATASFDGITYGKGGSSLKQLMYFLGEENFVKGLRIYFKAHAYKNTTIDDFMASLSQGAGKDLGPWRKAWLETSGLNTIESAWKCEAGIISAFTLKQDKGNGDQVLRPHRTQIALYGLKNGKLVAEKQFDVTYSEAETAVPAALGAACPALVFPNAGDFDYVKIALDPVSLQAAKTSLATLSDSTTRQMIWASLWEMVRDGKLSAQNYLDVVFAQVGQEKSTQVLTYNLDRAFTLREGNPALKYLTPDLATLYRDRAEKFLRQGLERAPKGSDLQLIWFQIYLKTLKSPEGIQFAKSMLNGKTSIAGIKTDQERRWELLQSLARNNSAGTGLEAELKKDATDMGKKASLEAQAMLPTLENKNKWAATLTEGKIKVSDARRATRGFFQLGQEEFIVQAADLYFDKLPKMAESLESEYVFSYVENMYPGLCEERIVSKTEALLNANKDLPAPVIKSLLIGKQEVQRCINARRMSARAQEAPTFAL